MRKTLVLLAVLAGIAGCDERYRYACQDPKNWAQKRCQRPDCLFTQDCPDYLVAPVLEKPSAQQSQDPASTPANR